MGNPSALVVEIRDVREQRYLGERMEVALDRIGDEVPAAYRDLYMRLEATNVSPEGPPFLVASLPQDGVMKIEVGVPCAEPPEEGALRSGTLPGGRVAVAIHKGSYDALGATYEALSKWIVEHGHVMAGPPREVYLTGPEDVSSPSEHVTEVVWPIG
ncbi:MAG: GyrI-like domain-containing protein [Actinomycetota bacterium]